MYKGLIIIEGVIFNANNLTILFNEGATEITMNTNHIRDGMWVHRNN